jgi:hypothetical protein
MMRHYFCRNVSKTYFPKPLKKSLIRLHLQRQKDVCVWIEFQNQVSPQRSRSSTDRIGVSEALDIGSIPIATTQYKALKVNDLRGFFYEHIQFEIKYIS